MDQLVAELGLKRVNEIWAEINAQLFTDPQEATRILFCNAMRKMKKDGGHIFVQFGFGAFLSSTGIWRSWRLSPNHCFSTYDYDTLVVMASHRLMGECEASRGRRPHHFSSMSAVNGKAYLN